MRMQTIGIGSNDRLFVGVLQSYVVLRQMRMKIANWVYPKGVLFMSDIRRFMIV
jgi:hypothetical protein